ncbi:MAG: hypothetical protein QNJ58_16290, partial [Desulfobacterales bacterium]|nr:hypothetical protein [Desulfobacterales bacterium]
MRFLRLFAAISIKKSQKYATILKNIVILLGWSPNRFLWHNAGFINMVDNRRIWIKNVCRTAMKGDQKMTQKAKFKRD